MTLAGLALLLAAADPACFTHQRTGVVFAAPPEGFVCSGARVLDAARDEVSVGYKATSPPSAVALTFYVYQKALPCCSPDATVQEHLEQVKAEVSRRYEDLKCETWSPPVHTMMSGVRCHGQSSELGPDTYVTYIGLEELTGWWLKVRATARAKDQAPAEDAIRLILTGVTPPGGSLPEGGPVEEPKGARHGPRVSRVR